MRTPELSSESGSCTVEVTIAAFNDPSLVSRIELEVVVVDTLNIHLLHYSAKSPGNDLSSIAAPAYGPESLQKLACGTANYQQVSIFTACTF